MRSWCLSVRLSFLISLSGCLSIIAVSSVWASEKQQDVDTQHETSSQIPQLSEIYPESHPTLTLPLQRAGNKISTFSSLERVGNNFPPLQAMHYKHLS